MKKTGSCPKCGSKEILGDVQINDYSHGQAENQKLSVATHENPDAMFFKGTHKTHLRAWICVGCGFTELYAVKPAGLITAASKSATKEKS